MECLDRLAINKPTMDAIKNLTSFNELEDENGNYHNYYYTYIISHLVICNLREGSNPKDHRGIVSGIDGPQEQS